MNTSDNPGPSTATANGQELSILGAAADEWALSPEELRECVSLLDRVWRSREESRGVDATRSTTATPSDLDRAGSIAASLDAELFGRFRVRRQIGAGGFGMVFLAFDELLKRDVALKVPHPESMLSTAARRRFLREAQAAATMDHRGILRVFDTGELGPAWYIVSHYCRGPNLGQWLADHAGPVGARHAAALIAEVSAAVQHAHVRGVLHRDLKPSNILLDPCEPADSGLSFQPLLSDFGLAKRLDVDAEHTRTDALVGTLRYMAPEQTQGRMADVDVRSDVYSLGVILYELLAGRPPFSGPNDYTLVHRIQCDEPNSLRAVRADVPRDLEAICLKCLRKAPSERYPSAAELADDLRRYLERRTVMARPVPWSVRCLRWCHRRPFIAALVSVATILLLAIIVGGVVAFERERALRQSAEWKERIARQAVDEMYTQVAERWLAAAPASEGLRKEFLFKALEFYDQLSREENTNDEVRHEMSRALSRAANIQVHLRMPGEAVATRRRCLAVLDALLADSPRHEDYRYDRFYNLQLLSGELRMRGDTQAAHAAFAQAFATIRQLVAEQPTNPIYVDALAAASGTHGGWLSEAGRGEEAKATWREGAALAEKLTTKYPDQPLYEKNVAENLAPLALRLESEGKLAEAEVHYGRAAEIYGRLSSLAPQYSSLPLLFARRQADRAFVLAKLHRDDEAATLLAQSLAVLDELSHKYPQEVTIQDQRHHLLWRTGFYFLDRNRKEDARRAFEQCLAYMDGLVATKPDYIAHRQVYARYLRDCPIVELRNEELAVRVEACLPSQ